ncbi:MAG: oligosaccharide flippase family protein [Bacteroidetes bacterium]|nr:oligosaccharide flippase family protein [Bacteroidota bacterium]
MSHSKINASLSILSHIGKLSGGYFVTTIINQAIPFLILPILTRYLSPAEYGNVALFSLYLAISNSITGVSVPTVIAKHFFDQEKEYIAKLVGNAIVVCIALSLITLLLIACCYPFIKTTLELPLVWILLIPLCSLSFIIFSLGLNVMRNARKVTTFAKHQISNTALNLAISLFLIIVLTWGWQGRVWGIILSFFVSAIASLIYLKIKGYLSFIITKDLLKTVTKVVLPLIPNSFQIVVISQVGILFIQYYFTKELLGVYSIGFQIAIIVKLLIDTLNMSFSPYLYEQISNKQKINPVYLTRMFYALAGILISGMLVVNLLSGFILKIMTTPEYYGAREFVPWISLGYVFYGLYVLLFPILIKNENQKFISTVTFLNMFVMIALNYLLIQYFGYIGVAYAFCLTYFMMFVAFFIKANQVMPLPWLKALKIWK